MLRFARSALSRMMTGQPSRLDGNFHNNPATQRSTLASHEKIWDWIRSTGNSSSCRVLEIGSRAVVSNSLWKSVIPDAQYTGFDYLPGPNVEWWGTFIDSVITSSQNLLISFSPSLCLSTSQRPGLRQRKSLRCWLLAAMSASRLISAIQSMNCHGISSSSTARHWRFCSVKNWVSPWLTRGWIRRLWAVFHTLLRSISVVALSGSCIATARSSLAKRPAGIGRNPPSHLTGAK